MHILSSDEAALVRVGSMGVGDRHSKRVAAEKAKTPSPIQRVYAVDDRELDDAFSAWDEDDAGARKPGPAQMAAASSTARTRVERKAGPVSLAAAAAQPAATAAQPAAAAAQPAATAAQLAAGSPGAPSRPAPDRALVDPVAMRDIVISRARTVDDPLTTRVLAEIARTEATHDETNKRGQRGPLPQRARTLADVVKVAPPKILSAATAATAAIAATAENASSGPRTSAHSPDTGAAEPPKPESTHTQPREPEEVVVASRRTTRRGIVPSEPNRKK
jgi:hypothetical protein